MVVDFCFYRGKISIEKEKTDVIFVWMKLGDGRKRK
jgi:hypothetical protein